MTIISLQEVARIYERAAYTACREAEQVGQEPPRLLSVFATAGGYSAEFLAPLASLREIREAIISAGGAYRAGLV